jgi:tripartite-type tricarboxylate transporter receptor subunit TctC
VVVERLYSSVKIAMTAPEVAKQFENLGLERADVGPAAFREVIAGDLKKWRRVVEVAKPTN